MTKPTLLAKISQSFLPSLRVDEKTKLQGITFQVAPNGIQKLLLTFPVWDKIKGLNNPTPEKQCLCTLADWNGMLTPVVPPVKGISITFTKSKMPGLFIIALSAKPDPTFSFTFAIKGATILKACATKIDIMPDWYTVNSLPLFVQRKPTVPTVLYFTADKYMVSPDSSVTLSWLVTGVDTGIQINRKWTDQISHLPKSEKIYTQAAIENQCTGSFTVTNVGPDKIKFSLGIATIEDIELISKSTFGFLSNAFKLTETEIAPDLMGIYAGDDKMYALVRHYKPDNVILWQTDDCRIWSKFSPGSKVATFIPGMSLDFAESTGLMYNKTLYLIGGSRIDTDKTSSDVYAFDFTVENPQWQKTVASFSPRMGHACVAANGLIYVLGGWDENGPIAKDDDGKPNDIWTFNPKINKWTRLDISLPSPRFMFSAIAIKDKGKDVIQIFGGFKELPGKADTLLTDSYYLDIDSKWKPLISKSTTTPPPPATLPYIDCTAVVYNNERFLITQTTSDNAKKIDRLTADNKLNPAIAEPVFPVKDATPFFNIQTAEFKGRVWLCFLSMQYDAVLDEDVTTSANLHYFFYTFTTQAPAIPTAGAATPTGATASPLDSTKNLILLLLFWLLAAVSYGQGQLTSVAPANCNCPKQLVLKKNIPQTLSFLLPQIPATIDSAVLLLVLQQPVTTFTMLEASKQGTGTRRDSAFKKLMAGYGRGKQIRMPLQWEAGLNALNGAPLQLFLKQQLSPNIIFYGSDTASYAPRLLVYYSNETIKNVDWGGTWGNAQHSGSTYQRFVPSAPATFTPQQDIYTCGSSCLQKDLVMYNNKLYAAVGPPKGVASKVIAIDPVTKQTDDIVTGLNAATWMPAISRNGIMYYPNASEITIIDLNKQQRAGSIPIPTGSLIASPTIGRDGTVYLSMLDKIAAYSPYVETTSPAMQSKLLWQVSLPGSLSGDYKSPVALDPVNTTAYVVRLYNNQYIITAINTVAGELKDSAVIALPATTVMQPDVPIPVITASGNVYVTNSLNSATALGIFTPRLVAIGKVVTGAYISQPVAVKDSVYYVKDGVLNKSTGGGIKVTPIPNFCPPLIHLRSLVADMSNNVFGLEDGNKNIYAYVNGALIKPKPIDKSDADMKALIIGPDGSLYSATDTIIAFKAAKFGKAVTKATMQQQSAAEDYVFAGETVDLSIPVAAPTAPAMLLQHRQMLVGHTDVNMGSVQISGTGAAITVESGGAIRFQNGFSVKQGATLVCKTGY